MPKMPRFKDDKGDYEVVLFCRACGWSIPKDRLTQKWKQCCCCGGKLEVFRVDYQPNPYGYLLR